MYRSSLALMAFLVAVFVAGAVADRPIAKNATFTYREANVYDIKANLGIFQIDFDQDLYIYRPHTACPGSPARVCENYTSTCPPCDYTDAAVCAGTKVVPGCPCPRVAACDIQNTLVLNGSTLVLPVDLEYDNEVLYKFFYDLRSDPCQLLVTEFSYTAHYFSFAYATAEHHNSFPSGDDMRQYYAYQRVDTNAFALCPTFAGFKSGTFVLRLRCNYHGYFSLGRKCAGAARLRVRPSPPALPKKPCTVPAALNATHRCISDGEFHYIPPEHIAPVDPVTDTGRRWNYYVYEVPASTDGKPVTIYRGIGAMIFASFTEPFPIEQSDTDPYDRINTVASIDWPHLAWQAINGNDQAQYMSFTFDKPTLMYLAVSPYPFYHPDPYFMFDSRQPWEYLVDTHKPWANFSVIDYQWMQQNVFYMDCKNSDGNLEHFQCPFYWDSSDFIDQGCTRLWSTYPIDDPNPFYPRPSLTSWIDTYNDLTLNDQDIYRKAHPNRLTLALALMSDHGGGYFTRLNNSASNLPTCSLSFLGNLGNKDREMLDNTVNITFTQGQLTTTAEDVNFALTRMSYWLNEIGGLSGQDLNDARFQLDVYQWGLPYKLSSGFVQDLYEPVNTTTTVLTDECLVANSADPCCDRMLTFTGKPCTPRNQTVSLSLSESLNALGQKECHEPRCSTISVSDFANVVADDKLKSCDQLISSESYITRQYLTPYQTCREQAMGVYAEQPSPCNLDEDCPTGIKCDVVSKNCRIPMSERIDKFLTCFLNETNKLLLIKAVANMGQNKSVFAEPQWLTDIALWKTRYTYSDCVDPEGIDNAIYFRKHADYGSGKEIPFCPHFEMYDQFSTVWTRCDNKLNTYYTMHIETIDADQSRCTAHTPCNWDQSLDNATLCSEGPSGSGTSFCAVCDTSNVCVPVPATSQAECNSRVACFRADGSVTMEASAAACQAIMSCEGNANATSQATCEAGGVCGETMYLYGGETGVCVVPFPEPWRFLECNFASQRTVYQGCADIRIPVTNCTANNGVWIAGATNRAACEAYGSVCYRPVEEFLSHMYQNTITFTSQNQADCLASDPKAEWRPMYNWTSNKWRGSNARTPVWIAPAQRPRWVWGSTFDFIGLSNDLVAAVQDLLRFNSKSYITCRFNKLVDSLRSASCDCYPGSTAENCFSESSGLTSSVTELCGGVDYTFLAPPASLTLKPNTLKPFGACLYSEARIFSSLEFKSKEVKSTATYFIDFSEVTDYSFRNPLGALAGQIIGDGVVYEAKTNTQGVTVDDTATLCVERILTIPTMNPSYTVLDFAIYDETSKKFTPLGVPTIEDPDTHLVCTNVTLEFGQSYFPIIHLENWESATRSSFTVAEFILIIILVALYAIVIIALVAKLHPLFVLRAFPFGVGVTIPLIILLILRLLYFSLLLGGAINLNQNNVGVFVIIEIPILFYLSCASYFVINWIFLTRVTKHFGEGKNIRKNIIKYFIAFNVAIGVIFIAFIIAFALIRSEPKQLCGGRIVEVDQTGPRVLSIVYRIYTAAMCLAVSIMFVIFGRFVLASMKEMQKRSKGATDSMRKGANAKIASVRYKMTAVAFTSVISLLLEAAFMVAIAFVPNYNNNILSMIIMVIAEIVPSIAIIVMVDVPSLAKSTADATRASMATQGTRSMYAQPSSSAGQTGTNSSGTKSGEMANYQHSGSSD